MGRGQKSETCGTISYLCGNFVVNLRIRLHLDRNQIDEFFDNDTLTLYPKKAQNTGQVSHTLSVKQFIFYILFSRIIHARQTLRLFN